MHLARFPVPSISYLCAERMCVTDRQTYTNTCIPHRSEKEESCVLLYEGLSGWGRGGRGEKVRARTYEFTAWISRPQEMSQVKDQLLKMERVVKLAEERLRLHELHARTIQLEVQHQSDSKVTIVWPRVIGADVYEVHLAQLTSQVCFVLMCVFHTVWAE